MKFLSKKFLPWLWLLKTAVEHGPATACTFLAFISDTVKSPKHHQQTTDDGKQHRRWERRSEEKGGGWRIDRGSEWIQILLNLGSESWQHGNQSWQLCITSQNRQCWLSCFPRGLEKLLGMPKGEKKAFAVTSPPSLDLNANIKVSLWIWNFMAVSRCRAVGETRLCTLA